MDPHYGRWAYSSDRPARWKDVSELWVHGYWVWDWCDQYQRVQKLDLAKQEVSPEPPFHYYGYRKGQRFYFLNVLEELDSPGEWFLDRKTQSLYFWPPCPIQQAEVIFPELQKPMLQLQDTPQHVRVCGLTLDGLAGRGDHPGRRQPQRDRRLHDPQLRRGHGRERQRHREWAAQLQCV